MKHSFVTALFVVVIATARVSATSSGNAQDSLPLGNPQCTNGLNRCLHIWESQYAQIVPYAGKGVCAYDQFPLNAFARMCQFDSTQGELMVVDCGGPGTNTVQIRYNDPATKKSSVVTTGSARAVFSKTPPKNGRSLATGTLVSSDINMDVYVYCYDKPALMRPDAHGKITHGTPSCNVGNGQGRCMSFWHADYAIYHPVEGAGTCVNTYPNPLPQAFVDQCSLDLHNNVHYPTVCDYRGISSLDISWDAKGNGKVVTAGNAKALFAQKPPNLTDLRSGTVTSSVLNENVYLYCPPLIM